jgi:Zn/Cd-binding protein ZinT
VKTVCATAFEDKEASEQELCDSGLDWTCVYPVFLNDATLSGKVDVQSYARVEKVRGLPKVSRADVAKVMLDAAADPKTIAQRLLITSPGSVTLAV